MTNSLEALLLARVEELPAIVYSPVLGEVLELLEDPDANSAALVQLVEKDRYLALHMVDLTSRHAERFVHGLEHAIRVVGFEAFKGFLTETLQRGPAHAEGPTLEVMQGQLGDHSVRVALCAHLLARETHYPNLSEAYTAGLFHDVGRALLNAYAYPELQHAMKLTQTKATTLLSAEDQHLGFNHSYLGGKLMQHWNMPPAIVEAVRTHHTPRAAFVNKRLAKLIHLADVGVNCQVANLPIGISLFPLDRGVADDMPVTKEKLRELARHAGHLRERTQG